MIRSDNRTKEVPKAITFHTQADKQSPPLGSDPGNQQGEILKQCGAKVSNMDNECLSEDSSGKAPDNNEINVMLGSL